MHPDVEKAFQEIDSAVFSSDTFDEPEARQTLKSFLSRWQKAVDEAEENWPDHFEQANRRELAALCGVETEAAPLLEVGGGIPPGKLLTLEGECQRQGTNFLDECMYGNDM
jgi:hypothetical protein